jgi:hypothetical protein
VFDAASPDRSAMSPFIGHEDAPAAMRWLVGAVGLAERAVHHGPDHTFAHADLEGYPWSFGAYGPGATS